LRNLLETLLRQRILVLDGAMGTLIQQLHLEEADYRGDLACRQNQRGNNDLLNLSRPEVIRTIHEQYLAAGADIIETNTFNANRISQTDFALEDRVYDLNRAGARLARGGS
jgi:5-methyltetrahydrofolate--homocysteine methyltransferase